MKTSVFAVVLYACLLLHGCSDVDGITGTGVVEPSPAPGPIGPASTSRVITGAVQKGPFILGTLVYANRLSAAGQPTSDTIVTTTQTEIGTFAFELSEPGVLQLFADGFHFNEITGTLSQGRLTLNAILDATSAIAPRSYVNVLTHLTYNRTLALLRNGMKASDAIAQAQADLVVALRPLFPAQNLPVFTDMSIYNVGDSSPLANAYLLAVSATAYQTAIARADASVDAELTLLLNTLADDLAQDGDIDNQTLIEALILGSRALDPDAIRLNLMRRSVIAINAELAVADLNIFIDTDGDGSVNAADPDDDNDNIADALDPQPYVKVVVMGTLLNLSSADVVTGAQLLSVETTDARIVAKVEYLANGEVIGQASAAPYPFYFNPYFWGDEGKADITVRVTDIGGNVTESQPLTVFIAPEVASLLFLTPSNGAVLSDTVTPTLSWIVGTDASKYEVQVWPQSSGAVNTVDQLISTSQLTLTPIPVGTYEWRVRAESPSNNWGPWTAVHTFSVAGPNAPALIYPLNATSVAPGVMQNFDWAQSPGASGYQIQISRQSTFATFVADTEVPWLKYGAAFAAGKHYWRVRAKNSLGFFGAWSEVRTFGVGLFSISLDNFFIKDAVSTSDSGVVTVGNVIGYVGVSQSLQVRDVKIVHLDRMGTITGERLITSLDTVNDEAMDIEPTADGGYIVLVSSTTSLPSDQETSLIKLDSSFNVSWIQSFTKPCATGCWSDRTLHVVADGYVVLGDELWKTDLQGNRVWSSSVRKTSSTLTYAPSFAFEVTLDGSIYLSGNYQTITAESSIQYQTYLMRFNANGSEAWRHLGPGWTTTMARSSDGSFILADPATTLRLGKFDALGPYIQTYSYIEYGELTSAFTTSVKPIIPSFDGGFFVLRHVSRATPVDFQTMPLEVVRISSQFEYVGYSVVTVGNIFDPTISIRPDGMLLVTYGTGLAVVDPVEGSLMSAGTPSAP